MEHKSGNGIFNSDDNNDDFEAMLEEKTKGYQWPKAQSVSEIIESQKSLPVIKDKKIEAVVSAEEKLNDSTALNETQDLEPVESSTDASDADGALNNGVQTEAEPVSPEATEDAEPRQKQHNDSPEYHIPASDPAYSQSIIDGKISRPVIRGIATGPWAHQYLAEVVVSQEQALENIGQPVLADFWGRMTRAAQHCNGDVEKLIHHIELLQQAAFFQSWADKAYRAELTRVIETGSEAERKKAEIAFAKLYKGQRERVTPDGQKQAKLKSGTPRAEPKPKVEKLLVKTKNAIDVFITIGLKQDSIIERLKAAGIMNQPALEYVQEHAKK